MSQEKVIRCDACSRSKVAGENTEYVWIAVQTIVGSAEEYASITEAVLGGTPLENVVDTGDFCSLRCLANWASARHEMRQLGFDKPEGVPNE